MQIIKHWHKFKLPTPLAEAVCKEIIMSAQLAIAERDCFKLVLAGATTPIPIYQLLAQQEAEWSKWYIYYGDERCLPVDHPERNSVMAQQALLDHVGIPAEHILTMPTELGNVEAAKLYQQSISDVMPFDMVLLGMGEDGHTASLFPGQHYPADELVHAVFDSPKPPPERISLSAKALSNTRRLVFIITGENKREAVQQWQTGFHLPVSMIKPEAGVDIYIDNAALG
jgi:6-phosphogluconolactonase